MAKRRSAGPAPHEVVPPRPLLAERLSVRKEELLDAVQKLVLADGFRSLRITDLASRLSTSYATLYSIARTKDELVVLVVDRWYARAVEEARVPLREAIGPLERLELWMAYGVAGTAATGPQFWADVSTHPSLTALVDTYSHYYVEVLEAILREGIAAGVFRPIDTRALAVYWEAASASLRDPSYVQRLQGISIGEMSALWVDLTLHGILTP